MTRTDGPWYTARVVRTAHVTPRMMRVTLARPRPLAAGDPPFGSSGHADEFFRIALTDADGEDIGRYYTIRRWDAVAAELDLDFVLHGHGPAATWAASAAAGDELRFDRPRGHYRPPAEARWIGLVGDATALPAIGRILDERIADDPMPVRVAVRLDHPDEDRQRLALQQRDRIDWLGPDADLATVVRAQTADPEPGYLWFSGEASEMRPIRIHLRRELRWGVERWMTMAYWRRDSMEWQRRYEQAGDALHVQLDAIYESAEDAESQRDRAEEVLTRYGL